MHRSIYLRERYSAAARVRALESKSLQTARHILPLVFILEGIATLFFVLSGGGLSIFAPTMQDAWSFYLLLTGGVLMGSGLLLWFRTFSAALNR